MSTSQSRAFLEGLWSRPVGTAQAVEVENLVKPDQTVHDPKAFLELRKTFQVARQGKLDDGCLGMFVDILSGRVASLGDDLRNLSARELVVIALLVLFEDASVPEGELFTEQEKEVMKRSFVLEAAVREVEQEFPGSAPVSKARNFGKETRLDLEAFVDGAKSVVSIEYNGKSLSFQRPEARVPHSGRRYPTAVKTVLKERGIDLLKVKKRCPEWPEKDDSAWDLFMFWLGDRCTEVSCIAAMYLATIGEKKFPSPELGSRPYTKLLATTGWRSNSKDSVANGSLPKGKRDSGSAKIRDTKKCLASLPLGPYGYQSEILFWCIEDNKYVVTDFADTWESCISKKTDFRKPLRETFNVKCFTSDRLKSFSLIKSRTATRMIANRDQRSPEAKEKKGAVSKAPSGMRKGDARAPVTVKGANFSEIIRQLDNEIRGESDGECDSEDTDCEDDSDHDDGDAQSCDVDSEVDDDGGKTRLPSIDRSFAHDLLTKLQKVATSSDEKKNRMSLRDQQTAPSSDKKKKCRPPREKKPPDIKRRPKEESEGFSFVSLKAPDNGHSSYSILPAASSSSKKEKKRSPESLFKEDQRRLEQERQDENKHYLESGTKDDTIRRQYGQMEIMRRQIFELTNALNGVMEKIDSRERVSDGQGSSAKTALNWADEPDEEPPDVPSQAPVAGKFFSLSSKAGQVDDLQSECSSECEEPPDDEEESDSLRSDIDAGDCTHAYGVGNDHKTSNVMSEVLKRMPLSVDEVSSVGRVDRAYDTEEDDDDLNPEEEDEKGPSEERVIEKDKFAPEDVVSPPDGRTKEDQEEFLCLDQERIHAAPPQEQMSDGKKAAVT